MAARGVKVRANESADTWTQVCLGLGDLQTARTEAARAVEETNKLQAKTLQTLAKGTGPEAITAAQQLYKTFNQLHSKLGHEMMTASHVLELVGVFGALLKADEGENADRRKRRRTGDPGSPSEAGTPPSTTAPLGQPAGASSFMEVGSQVAIRPMDQDWQLAIVVGVKQGEAGKWKYEVEDVDVDEVTGQRRRYVFPVKACVEVKVHRPEMPQATEVLALYPGTTCFYTAHVVNPPSRTRRASYIVQFEDDNGQHREVESKFVLPIPAKVRLKK